MFHPGKTLLFLICVGALCALTAYIFPEHGLQLGEYHFRFAKLEKVFALPDTSKPKAIAVEDLLAIYAAEDSIVASKDFDKTLKEKNATSALLANLHLQYTHGGKHPLHNFFSGLLGLKHEGTSLRVLHYGDSQIEGDRITSFLRNELQMKFGGSGPGMLPAVEVIPSIAIQQTASNNWMRYALFGGAAHNLSHNNFGALAAMARFENSGENSTAWIKFSPSRNSYAKVKQYNKAVLNIGNIETDCRINFLVNDEIVSSETVAGGSDYQKITKYFPSTPDELRIEFSAPQSPDVYGVSLESNSGIIVDNIAMRGGSGTVFRKIDKEHLQAAYSDENIGLILLQFGGNTVPYITDSAHAEQYGNFFAAQIKYLQSIQPLASFVVIGPSDMSTSIDGEMKTYPNLVYVRNALKRAAIQNGCAFWDMFEVMGGENSMINWVNASPPLAASDYVHFTPAGARKVAELFTKHLLLEFDEWKKSVAAP